MSCTKEPGSGGNMLQTFKICMSLTVHTDVGMFEYIVGLLTSELCPTDRIHLPHIVCFSDGYHTRDSSSVGSIHWYQAVHGQIVLHGCQVLCDQTWEKWRKTAGRKRVI